MTFDEYHDEAMETAFFPKEAGLLYPILGLVGEAGEVAEKMKKIIRDKGGMMTEEDRTEMIKEVGDVLWYIAAIADGLFINLDAVAQMNINKLKSRKERNALSGSGDNR